MKLSPSLCRMKQKMSTVTQYPTRLQNQKKTPITTLDAINQNKTSVKSIEVPLNTKNTEENRTTHHTTHKKKKHQKRNMEHFICKCPWLKK